MLGNHHWFVKVSSKSCVFGKLHGRVILQISDEKATTKNISLWKVIWQTCKYIASVFKNSEFQKIFDTDN